MCCLTNVDLRGGRGAAIDHVKPSAAGRPFARAFDRTDSTNRFDRT